MAIKENIILGESEFMKCPDTCGCGEPHYKITKYGKEVLEILRMEDTDKSFERLKKLVKRR